MNECEEKKELTKQNFILIPLPELASHTHHIYFAFKKSLRYFVEANAPLAYLNFIDCLL